MEYIDLDNFKKQIEFEMIEQVKREYRWFCGKEDFCIHLDNILAIKKEK